MRDSPHVAFICMNHITTFRQIVCMVIACLVGSVIGGGIIDHNL